MDSRTAAVGSVVRLWRYPVKSMQGEELNDSPVTERGILGDRAYAILDRATGHIASAKHPRKWQALLACRAAFVEPPRPGAPLPPVRITLPDGATIRSDQPDVDRILSDVLGRNVSLTAKAPAQPTREANRTPIDSPTSEEIIMQEAMALAAPAGTFFDYAALHLLTTTTIDRLRETYPQGSFELQRFRPNIVIAPRAAARGFVEQSWLGQTLNIGDIRLRLIDPCPRCVITTLAQGDLPRDPGILRSIGQQSAVASVTLAPGVLMSAVVGIYASVLREGMLRCGDTIELT
jgi:MOSC domain-containing protein